MENKDGVIAYKAFNADMTCRDFKYEVGKTYTHEGKVKVCDSGFHACTLPFDCWHYYTDSTTFARVRMDGVVMSFDNEDTKIAAAKITIEASLNLPKWIKVQVEAVIGLCRSAKEAFSTEDHANAATTGYRANAATTGEGANAATTGEGANAATTGYRANAATTGYRANAATTGNGANAATTGYGANAATTGNGANAATTGYGANAATTGEGANAATTGEGANAATTGNGANAATTGYRANAATTGKNTVAASVGLNGKAKAGENGCLVVGWWDAKKERPRVTVAYVGENGIKADTFYEATKTGELKEVA